MPLKCSQGKTRKTHGELINLRTLYALLQQIHFGDVLLHDIKRVQVCVP